MPPLLRFICFVVRKGKKRDLLGRRLSKTLRIIMLLRSPLYIHFTITFTDKTSTLLSNSFYFQYTYVKPKGDLKHFDITLLKFLSHVFFQNLSLKTCYNSFQMNLLTYKVIQPYAVRRRLSFHNLLLLLLDFRPATRGHLIWFQFSISLYQARRLYSGPFLKQYLKTKIEYSFSEYYLFFRRENLHRLPNRFVEMSEFN